MDVALLRDSFLGGAQSLFLFQQQEFPEKQVKQIVSIALFGALNGARNGRTTVKACDGMSRGFLAR